MKRLFPLLCAALLCGCAASHYVEPVPQGLAFYLRLDQAKTVQLAVSVDHFHLHDALRIEPGLWQVTVPRAREIKYFYLVDGTPYLPDCKLKESDDFGSANCIYLSPL